MSSPIQPIRSRHTVQRQAIVTVLRGCTRPLTPLEILAGARRASPRLGIATVYRAVKSLLDAQLLVSVQVPGEAARYEMAGKPHHHHFLCRTCRRVYDVEGCPGNLDSLAPDGFRLESHEVSLVGVCRSCAAARA